MDNRGPFDSPRFIPGKNVIRDLCLREKDNVQANRLYYTTFLRDAFMKLNLKTSMVVERVALPVQEGMPFIYTPDNYLEMSSISAPNQNGKLEAMIVNMDVKKDIADMSLINRCGCDCGCTNELCSPVRNFETITGSVTATMPDNTVKYFTTTFRKIILRNGDYVEETTEPTQVFDNNVHTDTLLQTTTKLLCSLDIETCGCLKETEHNREHLNRFCNASNIHTECGCTERHFVPHQKYEIDEFENKIYLPSHFKAKYVVLRYFSNTKTKDIMVPFFAKEPLMSGIKVMSSKYSNPAEKQYWDKQYLTDTDDMNEILFKITLSAVYDAVLARNKPPFQALNWNERR